MPSRRQFLQLSAATAALSLVPVAARRRPQDKPAAPPAPPQAAAAPLEKRKFGKTDMQVAILGFGGAEIGYEQTGQETVAKLLNAALDAGLNVVDTAECYIESETQIGTAIGHRRKEYFLFTKC